MRILHVVSTLARGGIASSLWHVIPHLGNQPDVGVEIATLYNDRRFGESLAQDGIPIHALHLGAKYDPRVLRRLTRLLREGSYDLVHVHGWPGVFFVALASLMIRDLCYVLGEHSAVNRRRRAIFKPLDRFIYSRYHRVVAVSGRVAEALTAWLPEIAGKICVVHNSVEPSAFNHPPGTRARTRAALGVPPDVPLLLFVGGLHRRKGLDVLLDALAGLEPGVWSSKPRLLICGEGGLRANLRAQAAGLGLTGGVRFLGYRRDVPELMAAADLFTFPSRREGCPMAVLEAMASGLPIVAAAVGGVPELIEDGVHGRLVPPADPSALAEAMGWMLAHPELAARMALRARARLRAEFTAEAAARQLLAVYREVLGSDYRD